MSETTTDRRGRVLFESIATASTRWTPTPWCELDRETQATYKTAAALFVEAEKLGASTGNAAADQILAAAPGNEGIALVVKTCMAMLKQAGRREASALATMKIAVDELNAAIALKPGDGFVARVQRATEFLAEAVKELTD